MVRISELQMKPSSFGGTGEPDQLLGIAMEIDSGHIQHGAWESGPGELELDFKWNETVYIVDGQAEVENLRTGDTFTLSAGSMMSFEQGSLWRWRIPWKLKKVFTIVERPI